MNKVFSFVLICILCFENVEFSLANELDKGYNATKQVENNTQLHLTVPDDATSGYDLKRRSRQFFFQPSYVVVQNLQLPAPSNCLARNGQPGLCREIGACTTELRISNQLFYLPSAATKESLEGYCFFYDQFGVGRNGMCCPLQYSGVPAFPPMKNISVVESPIDNDLQDADIDSETIHSPSTTTTMPEVSHETDFIVNNVDDLNNSWNYNGVRQWPFSPTQFGFQGLQWPPPLPTHPATIGRWPPPIPTHPPNHQYPTHPPSRPQPITTTTSTTTIRPIAVYPGYPTYRPPIAASETTIRPTTTTSTTTVSNVVTEAGLDAHGLPLNCGLKNPVSPDQERIVGGNNASPHEFPWVAVLFKSGKQFCGGSIITTSHILSAAHCVARMTPWDVAALTAHLGDYNIRTDFEVKHVSRRIKRLVRHKGFDFSTLHNDISILTLSEPVKFSYEIQPICLPTSNAEMTRSYSGYTATVVGWGSLRENGPQPSILQKVDIPVWSNSECQRKYGGAAPAGIIPSMLCAGQAAKDSCSGDSGGPLMVNDNGRYTQVGIVSWGIGCGKGQYPGVYTRVTSLLPWIYKNIK